MTIRRLAALGLLITLVASSGPAPAGDNHRVLTKSGADEATGLYSKYADDGSVATRKYLGNAGAAVLSAAELLPALVLALDQLSKYRRLVALPKVMRVPHARIEAMVCNAKCAALAVYRPGEGIYIDERLKPESQLLDRSILLHELVHYAQDLSHEHDDMRPCDRWYQREQEAYAIQKAFLALTGSPTRVGYSARQSPCDRLPEAAGNAAGG